MKCFATVGHTILIVFVPRIKDFVGVLTNERVALHDHTHLYIGGSSKNINNTPTQRYINFKAVF